MYCYMTTGDSKDVYISDKEIIKDCPYFDIDSVFYTLDGKRYRLALASVNGAHFMCFKFKNYLRLCSAYNPSFYEDAHYSREFIENVQRVKE